MGFCLERIRLISCSWGCIPLSDLDLEVGLTPVLGVVHEKEVSPVMRKNDLISIRRLGSVSHMSRENSYLTVWRAAGSVKATNLQEQRFY